MKHKKSKLGRDHKTSDTSPVKLLSEELRHLRRDLRTAARAYSARLEIALAESTTAVTNTAAAETLPREHLHGLRDLLALVRNRKLKPEKGRRKDLRKLESLIEEVHLVTHPAVPR